MSAPRSPRFLRALAHRAASWPYLLPSAFSILLAGVVLASLYPLRDPLEISVGASWQALAHPLIQHPIFITLMQRLIAFVPLGMLMQLWLRHRSPPPPLAISVIAVTLIALAIEGLQLAISQRHALLTDALIAAAAGCIGVALAHRAPAAAGVLLGNLICVCALLVAAAGASLRGWNCSYPLLVGNEATQDRPWAGSIQWLALYPFALPPPADSPIDVPPGPTAEAQMLYRFDRIDEGRFAQLIPSGPDLHLVPSGADGWQVDNGALTLTGAHLRSDGPASELCASIMQSRAFSIEAVVATAHLDQGGPARIVSVSLSPAARNFTLGQAHADLEFRVRTPGNNDNGSSFPLATHTNPLRGGWHHIVASYGAGVASLYVDGVAAPPVAYQQLVKLDRLGLVPSVAVIAPAGLITWLLAMVGLRRRPWPQRITRSLAATLLPPLLAWLMI